ncbi:MAG TPA: PocR ligand-binding domain-containing protein [Terriglobales bacterium]|nr:PocR ligand-binding domain-containing protein [Terriglobales bacterium]
MNARLTNPAEVAKDHSLVHFFALLAAIDDVDLATRLLTSGIASFLPVDAVALGFTKGEPNCCMLRCWQRDAVAETPLTPICDEPETSVGRAIARFGYPLQRSLSLVHLGEKIGYLAIARTEPLELSAEEEFLLTSLQTLTSLLLAKFRSDEALRGSQEWLRVTLTSIGDAVMTCDPESRVTFLNPVAEELSGWGTEQALGKPIQEIFKIVSEHSGEPATDIVGQVLREGRVVELANSTALVKKNGGLVPIEDSAAPIRDAKGNITGVVVVFHDVTEKRRAQEALRESEQRVRLKLESILSPEGDLGSLDLADIIDVATLQSLMEEFHELTRMPVAIIDLHGKVLVGVGWQDICTKFHRVNPDSCKHCIESDIELSAGVPPGQFRLYHCKNHMWDVATPITVGGKHVGNLFSGQFFFDGESLDYELFRQQAEVYGFDEAGYLAALERVTRLSRKTVSTGMSYLAQFADMISKLSYSNLKLARSLLQREHAEQEVTRHNRTLTGINTIFREAIKCDTDEDLGQTLIRLAKNVTGGSFGWLAEMGPDGALRPLAASDELSPAEEAQVKQLCGRVLQDGRGSLANPQVELRGEYTNAVLPILGGFVGVPLTDGGRTVGVIAVAKNDGTFRDEELCSLEALAPAMVEALHRQRAERALIRNEKLASVGRLAATIAHEVNNPLAGATNALYLVASDKSLSAQARAMTDVAERELRRAAQTARRILGFYREPTSPGAVSMMEVIDDLATVYESSLKSKSIRLQVRCADPNVAVIATPSEARQILSNLLANSIDAVRDAGTIHVRVKRSSFNGAPRVQVTVADTGAGIEPQNLRRLFEPFFTTKKDVGTGLGLWICQQIANRAGGRIKVRSRAGMGTVFSVELPAAAMSACSAKAGR